MSVGTHRVLLIPDPDVQAWGPQLASNYGMDTDIAGWGNVPTTWTWAAGEAVGNVQATAPRAWELNRATAAPIPRDASSTYRIRTVVWVSAATPVLLTLRMGTTAAAAHAGPAFFPADAIALEAWLWVGTAGYHTLEATYSTGAVDPRYIYLGPTVSIWPASRPFPSSPRISSIELQGQGTEAEDISCLIDQVTIHHGREDTDSQPDAATATLELASYTGTSLVLPDSLEIGGIIRVETDLGDTTSTRFVGRITDVALAWEDAAEDTPDRVLGQVMAASTLSDLGRRIVGDVPWPQELDGARLARIMSAAGITLDPSFSDPGTVQLLPRDVDSQPALDIAQAAATSAMGMVWHTRTGEVRYADANHRRGATAVLQLDACDLLVTPSWRRTTEGLINLVSIGYGTAAAGGEQPRYVNSRADSQDRYGRYELSATTELANLADAQAMGTLLLTRNVAPNWVMSELPVDLKGLDQARTVSLLSMDVHSLLDLTGLPAAGTAPTSAALWVEGWDETLTWGDHQLTLTVSGYCRTAPAPWWDDMDPAETWDGMGDTTWDDMTCVGPQPNQGRWNDQPASLRWNQVPAAQTWDTYS